MKIIINNDIYDIKQGIYLGEGKEGESYKFSSLVVKILDKIPRKLYLSNLDVLRLKDIETEVLDHPIDVANSLSGDYIGPVSKYIKSSGYYDFSNIKSIEFVNIINKMKSDASKYALKGYMIGDLQYEDSIFDNAGNLHLVDSGTYQYKPNLSFDYLNRENSKEIDNYLLDEVIDSLLIKKHVSKKKREIIKNELREEAANYDNVFDVLKDEIVNYDTLSDYVGSLKKR